MITKELKVKFLKNISEEDLSNFNNCWNWKGSMRGKNYGQFYPSIMGSRYAHRISWILFVDKFIKNLEVLHKCDNTLCVNPRHLFLGTQEDNMKDMASKNRSLKGENSPRAFISDEEVLEIKILYKEENITQTQLALKFGCSSWWINRIINEHNRN